MTIPVGIDLGTTNSAVARLDAHGRAVAIPNRLGETTTPSVLCFADGRVLVGREAKEMQAAGHAGAVAFFKRQMGDPNWIFPAAGQDLSATDLSALLLAALKEDAEARLGETVDRAVVTVPAYFREPQRRATLEAAQAARLEVLQLINEPTAAAVAFGLGTARVTAGTLLVYDLGGGTFDVTLLRLDDGEIRILTSDGDHELGGKDWDDRVLEYLASRFIDEHGSDPLDDPESRADLLVRAEEAKRRLSTVTGTDLSLVHDGVRQRYDLDRETFERITADLLERTFTLTAGVLDSQRMSARDLDGVVLVGGSTRMPAVRRRVRDVLGREALQGVDPDEAVALGAAVTAAGGDAEGGGEGARRFALAGAVRTVDVTNHSLGMIAVNEDGCAYVNSHILAKDTPVPCSDRRTYRHHVSAGGGCLEIFLTQGEETTPAEVLYLGLHVVRNVPPSPGGATEVEVEYAYDAGGVVGVAAREVASGSPLEIEMRPVPPDVPARFLEPPPVAKPVQRLTAYLAFDLSGSMDFAADGGERAIDAAKRAARGFVDNLDPELGDIGVIAFADEVKVVLRACGERDRIWRAIDGLKVGEVGIGNEADPFAMVRDLLRGVSGPRFVVTLADGVWEDQPRAVRRARACHGDGVESIAIGFGGADEDFLRQIASSDEGGIFTSLDRLGETFNTIAQVIGSDAGGGGAGGWRGALAGLRRS